MAQAKTAVIKFDKDKHGGVVRGGVNGQRFEFPVNTDVTVTEDQLNALRDSGATFSTVTPLAGEGADEGSSASSVLTGTATRLEAPRPLPTEGKDGEPAAVPELRQITDKELTGGADQQASQDQAGEAAPEPKAKTAAKKPAAKK
jgi:hypothetical protein